MKALMERIKEIRCINTDMCFMLYFASTLLFFTIANGMDMRTHGRFERSLQKEHSNRFVSMQAACTRHVIMVMTTLRDPFEGLVYAINYPSSCYASGNGTHEVKLAMNVSRCGVRIFEEKDDKLVYELHVYIQFDPTIQKATDEQVLVSCSPVDYMSVTSQGRNDPLLKDLSDSDWTMRQSGRKAPSLPKALAFGLVSAMLEEEQVETDFSPPMINAWMDILVGNQANGKVFRDFLRVGEEATMLVKIHQQPGLATKVVNCIAHDGTGDIQQELIDANGCTVETSIMPNLREKRTKRTGMKLIYAPFFAFKFPDKENLHLKCQVLVCIRSCPPQLSCSSRSGRKYPTKQYTSDTMMATYKTDESVIDVVDVFNAFEVKAPQIEINTVAFDQVKSDDDVKTKYIGANTTCLSTSTLILAFGILTGITVIAVVFSLSMFAWNRRHRSLHEKCIHLPYHSPYESYT